MASYVGSPSHRSRATYHLGRVFLVLVLFAMAAGFVWVLAMRAASGWSGPGISLFVYAGWVSGMIAVFLGLGALSRLGENARLERVVDRELDRLPADHIVFCGRPWMGEAAPRARSSAGAWDWGALPWGELTDLKGRPLGSISPHRVVVGPSGTWLVIVESKIPEQDVPSRRASAREQSLALGTFLRSMSFCDTPGPETFRVQALLADTAAALVLDVATGRSQPLAALSSTIVGAERGLSRENQRALVVALASSYPDSDRAAALQALDTHVAA